MHISYRGDVLHCASNNTFYFGEESSGLISVCNLARDYAANLH